MQLTEQQIYQKVASQEISVAEAANLLAELNQQTQTRVAAAPEPEPHLQTASIGRDASQLSEQVETLLAQWVGSLLDLSATEIDRDENFMDLGVDSTQLIQLTQKFEYTFNIELYPTLLFEYQNIKALAAYLISAYDSAFIAHFGLHTRQTSPPKPSAVTAAPSVSAPAPVSPPPATTDRQADIAIIGMAGLYADSPDLNAFWQHLYHQTDLMSEIPASHFDYKPWFDANAHASDDKTYCKWGSFIEPVAQFDAGFFNISPREAEVMDPQLRLLLQVLYTATEDAGYGSRLKGSKTGMYVGVCGHSYSDEMTRLGKPIAPHDGTGNAATMIANRPSFYFNLTGPSLAVDTACSSSLVALHLACQALRNNECDMAFAAGTNLLLCSWHYRYYSNLRALSPTGRCHTFDKRADGYVPAEGVGTLLLKPLAKALADNDRIHAVIKGSAINHGGYTPSITAPSVNQEAQVIIDAWNNAQIDPATLSYIEAHGTGTELGDPIEIDALKKAFKQYTAQQQFCAIGSAKAHIGHAEAAAGITGVIKVVLSMQHQQIPAMPQFETLNPYIKLEGSPLYINRQPQPWQTLPNTPRRAGVSSYGFGGAYAHVVLEEYLTPVSNRVSADIHLVPLSAKNAQRLNVQAENLLHYLQTNNNLNLSDLAYTLQIGREAMAERLVFIVADLDELQEKLAQFVQGQRNINQCYQGRTQHQQTTSELLVAGRAGQAFMDILLEDRELVKLARLWVSGVELAWQLLHTQALPQLITLPSYPFDTKHYWFTESLEYSEYVQRVAQHPALTAQHTQEVKPVTQSTQTETVAIHTIDLLSQTRHLFADLLKVSASEVDPEQSLLELGADSVILLQAVQRIETTFGVMINVRQLFENLNTVKALADYFAQHATGVTRSVLERASAPLAVTPQVTTPLATQNFAPPASTASAWSMGSEPPVAEHLTQQQQQHLDALIAQYTERTQGSKQQEKRYRAVFADMRTAVGFRLETKEMSYPLIAHRSQGANIWDVDGHEYIDLTMGFGVALFGHQPDFINAALSAQLKNGFQVGPQTELAGEVAQLISELTGMPRITFCNSGTEAVMTALRVARAATNRKKIVMFSGSYHGHFDGTMALASLSGQGSSPMAVGVLPEMVQEVLVLKYGSDEALDTIQAHAHELAAVLVEPVQSRKPDLQPKAFLHRLRDITQAAGTVLIFDEMITGFRIHTGGAQAWFGVQADMATYGKILGGGMPLGVVAGRAEFMARIDGGVWHYGDDSYPSVPRTFYAGTFCKHPLTMAATLAVLQHLKTEGAQLQQHLNARTEALAERLNQLFSSRSVPIRVVHFGSLFRFALTGNFSYVYQPLAMDLFFYHLIQRGIYVWELRTCFLSTAHTDADIERLVQAVQDSIEALQAGGFFISDDTPPETQTPIKTTALSSPAPSTMPLTTAQQQLWVLNQMDEQAILAYNLHVALQLTGQLNVEALQHAANQLLARHEALQTVISHDGEQLRCPSDQMVISQLDYSALSADAADTALTDWLQHQTQCPFDLAQAPLLRLHLVKMADDRHVLTLTMQHILIDGWSSGVIVQELLQLYAANCAGESATLPAAMQWRDYLTWQAKYLGTEQVLKQKDYWLEKLKSVDWTLNLPMDQARPVQRTYQAARCSVYLDQALSQSIRTLAKQHNSTLFMTLLSVYSLLLHRLSGQNSLIVGIMSAGRAASGSESLIGYCSHILPIHSQLAEQATFVDYLQQLKSTLLEAYQHQDYPFALLMEQLQTRRDVRHMPLVSTLFNLERPISLPQVAGLQTQVLAHPISYDEFDFGLNVTDLGDELLLDFDYNTHLFEARTIQRFLGHFQTLLAAVVTSPQQRGVELPLLNAREREQQLVEWNNTHIDYPEQDACFQQLFEQQAAATPAAIALRCADKQLSYAELNERANQLAHYLRQHEIGAGAIVGLAMSRSLTTLVGLLGILKTGAAYLPLDVSFPHERLSFMLTETQATLVLVQNESQQRALPVLAQLNYLCLAQLEATTLFTQPTHNLALHHTPDALMYVLYTSGSTGKPKGVMVSHRGLVNYVCWCTRTCALGVGETTLVHSSLAFDLAITGLLPPLIAGGCVELLPDNADMDAFAAAVQQGQYSLIKLTPSHLEALNQLLTPSELAGRVKVFVVGGELLKAETILPWRTHAPDTRIINHYGPTETVVGCCTHDITAQSPHAGGIPIGRPLANTQLFILDKYLQAIPVGMVGELYIGGRGVAKGYLQRADLTAERFINNPFSPEQSQYLYKTGDLARYRPDGQIEFLGRIDFQVKLRGFRIELNEIEAVLRQHAEIKDSVVMLRADNPADSQLVAYLVVTQPDTFNTATLKPLLSEHLPSYMHPSAYVLLAQFPLNANGKIDRHALPAPAQAAQALSTDFVAPRTDTEKALSRIWCDVLNREQVGVDDNFYDLGGHSLKATQIVSRIQKQLGKKLSLKTLLNTPTIAELARILDQHARTQLLDIEPVALQSHYPLSSAQKRLWAVDAMTEHSAAYNMVGALLLTGDFNRTAFKNAFEQVVMRHESLRTTFILHQGEPRQKIHAYIDFKVEEIDLSAETYSLAAAQHWVTKELNAPFDLAVPPLLKVKLLRLSVDEQQQPRHVLLVNMHHIISDGWSLVVLVKDLLHFYQNPQPLPALSIQYKDYAHWQTQLLNSAEWLTHKQYWQTQLSGELPTLNLPTDFPRPAIQSHHGAMCQFMLSTTTQTALHQLARRHEASLFMLLSTFFYSALQCWTNQKEFIIGAAVAGRNHPELENQIGFYINMLPLRIRLQTQHRFSQVLQQVKQVITDAYAHQDYPFDELIAALNLTRDRSRNPLFDAMINVRNNDPLQFALDDVNITTFMDESVTSKFDLEIMFREVEDGIQTWLEYNTDLFKAETAQQFAGDFQALIDKVLENPEQSLLELKNALQQTAVQKEHAAFIAATMNIDEDF